MTKSMWGFRGCGSDEQMVDGMLISISMVYHGENPPWNRYYAIDIYVDGVYSDVWVSFDKSEAYAMFDKLTK